MDSHKFLLVSYNNIERFLYVEKRKLAKLIVYIAMVEKIMANDT